MSLYPANCMHTGKSRMILDILSVLLFVFGVRSLLLMYLERRRDVLYRLRRARKIEQAENDRELS